MFFFDIVISLPPKKSIKTKSIKKSTEHLVRASEKIYTHFKGAKEGITITGFLKDML